MLEFLNILEDDKPRLSWTKIGLVGSTVVSLVTSLSQIFALMPSNTTLVTSVFLTNVAAMVKHEVKRWQTT